jgi:spermidine synthase
VAGVLLAFFPPSPPWTLLSSSPLQRKVELGEIVYAAMGRSSTVMLTAGETEFTLKTNGLRESVILREGMQPPDTVARWLGLLPTLLRPDLSEMLVVGLGGGMALEPIPSTVETIDIVELEHEALAIAETLEAAAEPNSRRAAGSLWWPGASLRLTL